MNIFELIVSDPLGYQQAANQFTQHNANWMEFKQTMNILFGSQLFNTDQFILKSKQLWTRTLRTSPSLIPVMIEFYLNQLEKLVEGVLDANLHEISSTLGSNQNYIQMEITTSIQAVFEKYCVHEKYIRIFDQENRYLDNFRKKIHRLLNKYSLKNKVFILLQKSFLKNSLKIITEEIIDFDEPVRDHIKERCKECENFNFEYEKIQNIFKKLHVLQFADEYFEEFYNFLNRQSELFITMCDQFSEGKQFLSKSLNYERTFQKHFIKRIRSPEDFLLNYINQLDNNIYCLYAKYCSRHILDIILDFPDSLPVIQSLSKSLDKAPLLNEVGEYLNKEIQKRLLIPGVLTQNILNQYLNMLKVLQRIDSQGAIFEKITLPIKKYLLNRKDTLRCIISHLTDDINNEERYGLFSSEFIQNSSDEDEKIMKEWTLPNSKGQKNKKKVKYQQIDLATVLISLYGSQEAFIGEYQNMMAQKIMSAKGYNIEEEMRNIELLKIRFGQSALQVCNIIIKDVQDSRRNDGKIHAKKVVKNPRVPISISELNCLSVSKGYWPINYENTSSFKMPQQIKEVFDEYSKSYSETKAMRKITFHNNLGHVNLTLSFENGNFQFKCLPLQAILISALDETKMKDPKNGVSSEQLSNELQVPSNIIKQKMSFWVHKGVVKETRIAKQGSMGLSLRRMASTIEDTQNIFYKPVVKYENIAKEEIDDDFETSLFKESSSMESHLKHIIEGLILSILNTNGPKSLEKIHLLLKTVYKTDLDYTYGQAQTAEILKKMLQKKKINFNGEVYSSKEE